MQTKICILENVKGKLFETRKLEKTHILYERLRIFLIFLSDNRVFCFTLAEILIRNETNEHWYLASYM